MKTIVRQALCRRWVMGESLLLAAALWVHWSTGTLQAQTPGPADTNLVLRFDFEQSSPDGRVPDLSGKGNDGWQFNQTNLLSYTNGVFGSTAAQFTYVGFLSNDLPNIYHF